MLKLFHSFLLLLVFFISCKKVQVTGPSSPTVQLPPPPPPPFNPISTAPSVFAGSDIYIVFPADSCTLRGSPQYPQNIQSTVWQKISGPVSGVIERPRSVETKLHQLEKGIYVFELTVTDNAGIAGRDTVSVYVLEKGSGQNEIMFKDQQWQCPMGCSMLVENFHPLIPIGVAFKAFVKSDHSTEWFEVVNMSGGAGKYVWTIYNNGLVIFEDQPVHPNDSPDVKIIF